MIKFEIKNKTYTVRTQPKEISLKEFSKIAAIQAQESEHVEKWLKVLDIVSDNGLVNEIGIKGLTAFINEFTFKSISKKIKKKIQVNGRTYIYNEDPSAKTIQQLEKVIAARTDYAAHVFAILYEDTELTNIEHQEKAHIDHKAKLFGEQIMSDVAFPVIVEIGRMLIESVQGLDESTPVATA
jgi:hypothetical protein